MRFTTSLRKFLRDSDATTAVEYAVMLALILITLVVGLTATGGGVSDWWNDIGTELNTNGF